MSATLTTLRKLGASIAVVVNLVFVLVLALQGVWRPWLGGFLTADFGAVVWALALGPLTHILANLVVLAHPGEWWGQRVMGLVKAGAGLVAAAALWSFFPFDFTHFVVPTAETAARVLLFIVLMATSIATVAALVNLALPPAPGRRIEH
jgi:hypothetical protein